MKLKTTLLSASLLPDLRRREFENKENPFSLEQQITDFTSRLIQIKHGYRYRSKILKPRLPRKKTLQTDKGTHEKSFASIQLISIQSRLSALVGICQEANLAVQLSPLRLICKQKTGVWPDWESFQVSPALIRKQQLYFRLNYQLQVQRLAELPVTSTAPRRIHWLCFREYFAALCVIIRADFRFRRGPPIGEFRSKW